MTYTFSAPLGGLASGRLIFAGGVHRMTLRVDGGMAELFTARFEGREPRVDVSDGTVTVRYRHPFGWLPDLFEKHEPSSGELVLNGRIPWRLDCHGGVNHFECHLDGLILEDMKVGGGTNHLDLELGVPRGTVTIMLGGGTNHVDLRRPAGVAARLDVGGGTNRVEFDGQRVRSGGGTRLESPGYEAASDRYRIMIGGGANKVSVGTLAAGATSAGRVEYV